MRNREVYIQEGYDGEYGVIRVFREGEAKNFQATGLLFRIESPLPPEKRELIDFDLKGIQRLLHQKEVMENLAAEQAGMYNLSITDTSGTGGLNPEQLAAVQHTGGPSLIIAGPGTGKTRTLTEKIAWLVNEQHVNPDEVLAITFTNKAARELRERLQVMMKDKTLASGVTVSTFHAFGLSVLKTHYNEFQRSGDFILADEVLKQEIIRALFETKSGETVKLAEEITGIKNFDKPETPQFRRYEEELKKLNAFDLDDLIAGPLQLLSTNPAIRAEFQQRYLYLFVDEYQDTNEAQYRLLRQLASGAGPNLCVVGDANQSVYGFRGAHAGYIRRFTEDYPGAAVFRLTRSYRCSQTILSASANVLEDDSGLLEGLTEGVRIAVSEQPTGAAEAEFIARRIIGLVGGVSFFSIDSQVTSGDRDETIGSLSDLAVLCRTRNQFDAIAKALRDHHIPYQETGTTPFFREEPFRSFTSLLKGLCMKSWEQAIPVFRLGKHQVTQSQFDRSGKMLDSGNFLEYLEWMRGEFFGKELAGSELWDRFITLAAGYGNLQPFLEFLSLGSGADTHSCQMEAVSLMTLHASKGLEFECVFIPGCEEGLIPYNLYQTEVDREEEKRLLYVGMTRAKRLLFLTHARSRILRGRTFRLPESPFLKPIQQHLLQQIKNSPPKKPEGKDSQLCLF